MSAPITPDPWKPWHAVALAVVVAGLILTGFIMGVQSVPPCRDDAAQDGGNA